MLNDEPAIGNLATDRSGNHPLTSAGLANASNGSDVYYSFHDPKFQAFANRYDNTNNQDQIKIQARLAEFSIDKSTTITPLMNKSHMNEETNLANKLR